jgi:transitional endoplasmic reticulum ATPase
MNEKLREYYGKIQQHFKGGLPQKVQPPAYQYFFLKKSDKC